ncbi:hypothetical protein QYF61_008766 [Mycteria americana]|uniref:Uncharacterized protein n=1 Tax=Mycteria americana TaxID=33587 RepID=A0AAN7MQ84_MYCAM|nr:hypothetical protein QYF61_008766 [Mycteria americana]
MKHQDEMSPITGTSRGHRYVLTMAEITTGWLETYLVAHATAKTMIASNPGKLTCHLIEGCLAYPNENQQLLALYWGLACAYRATVQYYQRTMVEAGTQTTCENTLTETRVQTTSEDMIVEIGTQTTSEDTMVEIGTQTTTTVIAPVVKKKQWTRRSTGPYHQLVREEEEEEGSDQEAGPSAKKWEEGVREFRQEVETTKSLTSSEL